MLSTLLFRNRVNNFITKVNTKFLDFFFQVNSCLMKLHLLEYWISPLIFIFVFNNQFYFFFIYINQNYPDSISSFLDISRLTRNDEKWRDMTRYDEKWWEMMRYDLVVDLINHYIFLSFIDIYCNKQDVRWFS